MRVKTKERMPISNEEIVFQYFKFIESKNIDGILDLFDSDAIVYEPFSKEEGLKGSHSIEPFIKVAMMANSNLKRLIEIEKSGKSNKVVALVTFEKGDKVKGKFTFEFTGSDPTTGSKIKSLNIEF